ncbi:MAG TPA: 6-phosphogluconolactonase [Acidimicrobiales bacterium]|nr:6-phosphogluconolactonase [Acidimicrobiales bacterium]
MRIVVAAGPDEVARRAADWIEEAADPERFLALAVGASVEGAYLELRGRPGCLGGIRTVSLDELHPLPVDDPRTFGGRLQAMLGTGTGMQLERFDPSAPDPAAEAQRVERLVRDRGLAASVLGLGPNGHLAFNEPGDPFHACSRAVTLRRSTLAHLGGRSAIAPATGAMTLGLPVLLDAPRVLLVVLGDKRAAFARLVLGPLTPRLPASVLRLHPDVTVLCTAREAADIPPALLELVRR